MKHTQDARYKAILTILGAAISEEAQNTVGNSMGPGSRLSKHHYHFAVLCRGR